MASAVTVRAAGGVVVRAQAGGLPQIALVHRPAYDDWSLPKGKLQAGESEEHTALREVEEETGMRCRLERSLGTTQYLDRRGRSKVVHYWVMRALGGQFAPTKEVDELSWVSVDRALRLLTYDHDRDLVRNFSKGLRAAGEHESTGANADGSLRTRTNGLIYLVRHAKAGNRSAWDAADEERPLSKSGRKQARALVERLAAFSIGRIISSPHVRCRETVEPLAQHRGLAVETSECLSEGSDSDDALELLSACAGKPTVLCSHGDIVGDVLTALAAEGMAADSQLRWEKGSIWALESDGRSFVYGRYLPPP